MNVGEPGTELALHHVMFTDIEGSTPRWERDPDGMRDVVRRHDELLARAVERSGGHVLKRTGDGLVATFPSAVASVTCAVQIQREIGTIAADPPLAVRIGVHSGLLEVRLGDLHGPPMNRAARIMGCAHGGQIVVSAAIRDDAVSDAIRDDASAEPDRLGSVGFRALGCHRLRGLLQPEELFQVVADGLADDFAPISSLNASLGWLPAMPDRMIGRAAELDAVAAAAADHSVVSLVGPSGVGKTCLALHCAGELRAAYPDGAWFVDLAAVSDPSQVVPAIATSIRLERAAGDDLTDRLRRRCAEGALLLVLDNCEHLHRAVVDAVSALRAAGGATTFLCTTQRRLGVPGEAVITVAPLEVDPGADAVALFVERAGALGVTIGDDDLAAVATICRELDGLPLAIELAAARCAVLPPAAIAARLDDRFGLLRRRDGVERHQTLAGAIAWSYDLLGESERYLLRAVSVFQGPFDVAAAELVAGEEASGDLLDDLAELVDRSMVGRSTDGFRLLDSLRRFAADRRGDHGEDEAALARHARWVEGLVMAPLDRPDPEATAAAIRHLTVLRNDVRLGLATMLDDDPERAAMAMLGLVDYWTALDLGAEALEWLGRAAALVEAPEVSVELLGWMAAFGWLDGRNDDGARWATDSIELAAAAGIGFPVLAGSRLAVHRSFSGETEAARALVDETLAALATDDRHRPRLLGVIAVVLGVLGELERAVELADEAVRLSRDVGAIRLTTALSNRVMITPGRPEAAGIAAELADLSERLGRAAGRAQALLAIAQCERAAGNLDGFVHYLAATAEVMQATNQRTPLALVLDMVPPTIAADDPLAAATMLGANARAHAGVAQRGLDATVAEQTQLAQQLRAVLGADAFDQAFDAGAAMSVDGAVDLLRWISQSRAPVVPAGASRR